MEPHTTPAIIDAIQNGIAHLEAPIVVTSYEIIPCGIDQNQCCGCNKEAAYESVHITNHFHLAHN
jgi:hypothetical protein